MIKNKVAKSKLSVKPETLRTLSAAEQKHVIGGATGANGKGLSKENHCLADDFGPTAG